MKMKIGIQYSWGGTRVCISNKVLTDAAGVHFGNKNMENPSLLLQEKTDDRVREDQPGYINIIQKQSQGNAGISPLLE